MKRFFPVLISFILASPVVFALGESSMTVELGKSAVLIRAESEIIEKIRELITQMDKDKTSHGELVEKLTSNFGKSLTIELFEIPGLSAVSGSTEAQLSVREAILRGLIPPIEGLGADNAVRVLEKFGFVVFKEQDYKEMSEGQLLKEFYLLEGTALVISGTGPFDVLTIYRKKTNDNPASSEPAEGTPDK